ncbi:MAG: hypothetical protein LKI25_00455 [Atopobiaceae bacterium]|jgi:hypothetical protein|nr:hypothetical protein [Atopobiaceae bacterium]MCI2172683.1 hypothetical protein [Atopobiaceae bacterium]MCI2206990.1 hypothetical protein [Atopobiaceae bacterium]
MGKSKVARKGQQAYEHDAGREPTGTCEVCGRPTDDVATVYICTDSRGDGARLITSYERLSVSMCAGCAQAHHDSDHKRIVFYLLLQLCWSMPIRHGISLVGILGAAFGIYGLVMLVRVIADNWWRRHRTDKPEPAWLSDGETDEDLASTCLRDRVAKEYKRRGKRVETLREYHRGHGEEA